MKWISVHKEKPRPYQTVEAKGVWKCKKMIYLDDENNGWEQKKDGHIEVTHWKPLPEPPEVKDGQ
jgi:hypothetical protein